MSNIAWINDVDVETLGLTPTALPSWSDGLTLDYPQTAIPGRLGVVLSRYSQVTPRTVTITGLISGATWTARRSTLREILSHCAGECTLKFGDATSQYTTGYLIQSPVAPLAATLEALANSYTVVSLTFLCPSPLFWDTSNSTVSNFASTATDVPLGTAPSGGSIVLSGGTNPVLKYRDSDGNLIEQMTFTADLTSDTLTIDLDNAEIESTIAGNPWSLWTGLLTGERFISPSPSDGDYRTSAWPTLEVTTGTGTYTYKKAWTA